MKRQAIWSLVTIGWMILVGISPCAGESPLAMSSLPVTKLFGSEHGYQKTFHQAVQWYRQSNWEHAALAFAHSARQASDFQSRLEALFYEAECLVQLGRYAKAHLQYDAIVGDLSSNPLRVQSSLPQAQLQQAQFRLGETAWLAGDRVQAEIELQQFIQQWPENLHTARALLYLGDLAIAENHQQQAVSYYRRILELRADRSQDVAARLGLGKALLAQGESSRQAGLPIQAQQYYEQLLKDCPRNAQAVIAMFRLGEMARQQGNLGQGMEYYRQIHAKFPQTAQAREAAYWLALHATDNKDGATARRYTDWLLRVLSAEHSLVSPDSSFHRSTPEMSDDDDLEEFAFMGQQAAHGLRHATKKIAASSRDQQLLVHALYLQSQLAAAEGQWDQVSASVAKLLENIPTGELQTAALFWQAEAEFRLGHDAKARQHFRELEPKVLDLEEPWVPMVSLRQAQLAAGRQQWTQVLQRIKKLRNHWPDFPLAYEVEYLYGQALAGHGEMSTARIAYRRVLDSSLARGTETAAMAQWMIGETYFHQYQYQQARDAYDRVIDEHPFTHWQALAALQSGKCWELEGNWKQAKKLYVNALQRKPGAQPAQELQARLRWAGQSLDSGTKR